MIRQKSFENENACLYLVATPIGNLQEMTPRAIEVLKSVDLIAAEDTRNTLKLLRAYDIKTHCIAHHSYNEKESAEGILDLLRNGKNVAIVSDAGYPLISDPGQILVDLAGKEGFNVIPISGCNAALNALVASGICAQPFMFYGFLPVKENDCKNRLEELKQIPAALIFYEAPHRIDKMLRACLEVLGDRHAVLARELTKKHEEFLRGTLSELVEVAGDLKGEMVLVVEGPKKEKQAEVSMEKLVDLVEETIQEGYSTKEAIKKIAQEFQISKNDLYSSYHQKQK